MPDRFIDSSLELSLSLAGLWLLVVGDMRRPLVFGSQFTGLAETTEVVLVTGLATLIAVTVATMGFAVVIVTRLATLVHFLARAHLADTNMIGLSSTQKAEEGYDFRLNSKGLILRQFVANNFRHF